MTPLMHSLWTGITGGQYGNVKEERQRLLWFTYAFYFYRSPTSWQHFKRHKWETGFSAHDQSYVPSHTVQRYLGNAGPDDTLCDHLDDDFASARTATIQRSAVTV